MKAYILPENRRQEIKYYNKGQNIVPGFPFTPFPVKKESDTLHGRVLSISEPVGTDATLIPTYRFIYHFEFFDAKKLKPEDFKNRISMNHDGSLKPLKSGSTVVLDALGKITHYTYDGHLRLTGINHYLEGNLYRQNNFLWGPIQHTEKGNLLYKTLSDAQGQIYSFIAYFHDSQGNVINEQLTGILTGKNFSPIAKNSYGIPHSNGCDVFVKNYVYSQDGLNLLLQESDGRKQINYSYHPGTNLLTAKLISDNGIIKCREFFHYDLNGQPTIQIKDDGCTADQENLQGVSERHITRIQYRQTIPIGLPQIIEEFYLNLSENQEVLLKKIENVHDLYGNLVQQKHYDSEGCERYSLFWEYNSHNKVVKETNAASHVTSYDYDQNDNLVFEQHPGNDYYTRHIYDFSNRLIRSENVFSQATHITHYSYNLLGQKVSATDWYGQKTTFEYDDCGRLKNITYPAIPDENEAHLYDLNGNLIQKGSLKLTYDGLDRLIHVEKENESMTYRYDELNRRLLSIHRKGTTERTNRFVYQGLNEIGVCDKEGNIKQLRVLGLGKGAEIGAAVLIELDGTTYAPIHDRAGNVRALIHADQGTLYETYRYSAYGEEQIFDSNNRTTPSINPWRFSSKRTDDETGFVYFGRRYYNPVTTRWVTADPLGFDAGPNLYAYVFNNPFTSFDLYGLRCRDEDSYSSQRHERNYGSRDSKNSESNETFNHRKESFYSDTISDIKSIEYVG